jgi:hypothetical protein
MTAEYWPITSDPRATKRHRAVYRYLAIHAVTDNGQLITDARNEDVAHCLGLQTRGSTISRLLHDLAGWRYLLRVTDGRGRAAKGTRWRIMIHPSDIFNELADRLERLDPVLLIDDADRTRLQTEIASLRSHYAADMRHKDARIANLRQQLTEALDAFDAFTRDINAVTRKHTCDVTLDEEER